MRGKIFNTAGPCDPEWHYMLPPEARLQRVEPLIERAQFFAVHAPRQAGKTTSFRALAERLTGEGAYAALWVSCETAQAAGDDAERGVAVVVQEIEHRSEGLPEALRPPRREELRGIDPLSLLRIYLARWAERSPRPVVLLLDEIDALRGNTLVSVLRQLRSGFPDRPNAFPQSVALIGLRDVKDYRLEDASGSLLGTSSPFNVKVESLKLRDFTEEEVSSLLHQHEAATGQVFEDGVSRRIFELTQGQPWLVNAMARQLVEAEVQTAGEAVRVEHVEMAKERLILRRDTHLDSLAERLREPRVRRVIEPILSGGFLSPEVAPDDVDFVEDLGLISRQDGDLQVANPIYREVIPRTLSALLEISLPAARPDYLDENGRLIFRTLLDGFATFWRHHAESVLKQSPYSEASAQLVFMAFLHKIVNGGGFIDREYAVGRGRIDLCLRWPHAGGLQRFAIELKVRRGGRDVRTSGLDQLADYLERLELAEGTLVLFAADPPGVACFEQVVHRDREITVLSL